MKMSFLTCLVTSMYKSKVVKITFLFYAFVFLTSCVSSQPQDINDVCAIFGERRGWFEAAKSSEERWGIPIAVNMAIIYQESSFRARAKPERSRVLWVLPGPRASSAYGYSQALDSTWKEYKRISGRKRASRSDFKDAVDFVGWYNANSSRASSIAGTDAHSLYLAYHEGNAGFQRGSYRGKQWLIEAANRVQMNSERFNSQLDGCSKEFEKGWLRRLFS